MAGTPLKVTLTGNPSSDVMACASVINAIIAYLDTHTHSGVTTGAGNSGAVTTATTATPIYDAATNSAITYLNG